jgi:serine/threonine protein kinase
MQIGKYKVLKELGAGGMGIVYLALDVHGRQTAIKMIGNRHDIRATVHKNSPIRRPQALDIDRRMMFVREASLAIRLHHPNIVQVFDYGQDSGLLFIVMEYLPGRSLEKMIPLHHSIPLTTKVSLITQLCEALDYAHKDGVIHRDIKPANAIVSKDFRLKVLDFGLAAMVRQPETGKSTFAGTYLYMAPEIVVPDCRYNSSIDIWAAGVTFYQFLTGRLPFVGASISELLNNIAHAPFTRLPYGTPHADKINLILDRALAKDPGERYRSAADFAQDLRRLEGHLEGGNALHPDNEGMPGEHSSPEDKEALTSPSPAISISSSSERVSMSSGVMPSRRNNHMLRCSIWNRCVFTSALFFGLPIACIYPFAYRIGFRDVFDPIVVLIPVSAYVCGIVLPVALSINLILALAAFWHQLAEVPRCKECRTWMQHKSRITRLAHTETSWRHAFSDCLAALHQNLWEDAAKLLSLFGQTGAPMFEGGMLKPLIRYHLDFYMCPGCGDENALISTEDKIGAGWKAREEYSGAYKGRSRVVTKRSVSFRTNLRRICSVHRRTARLVLTPVPPLAVAACLMLAVFVARFYYPPMLEVLGVPGYRASITILSDPAGLPLAIDGEQVVAPRTFSWPLISAHTIDAGDALHYRGIRNWHSGTSRIGIFATGDPQRRLQGEYSETIHPQPGRHTVVITPVRDRWGRWTTVPEISSYTVSPVEYLYEYWYPK